MNNKKGSRCEKKSVGKLMKSNEMKKSDDKLMKSSEVKKSDIITTQPNQSPVIPTKLQISLFIWSGI